MKKIVASMGLVALGVSSVQAAPGITTQASKPWSVSATLRGFYDDNIESALDGQPTKSAFGVEVRPSAGLNWGNGQTTLLSKYTYSLRWYDKPISGKQGRTSQQHLFDLALGHAFSERYSLEVDDTFAIGQEPDILRGRDTGYTTIQTIDGNNIRNSALIRFNAELTPVFGLEVGYLNNFYDYEDDTIVIDPGPDGFLGFDIFGFSDDFVLPSNSGVQDRVEQTAYVKGRWEMTPETRPFGSYKFRMTDFTANEVIAYEFGTNDPIMSDQRDTRSHIFTVGVEHDFRPDLSGDVEVGVEHREAPNDPESESELAPYVQVGLRYVYLPSSALSVGFRHQLSATPQVRGDSGRLITDSEASVFFVTATRQFQSRLYGSMSFTFQNNTFKHSGAVVNSGSVFNTDNVESQRFYALNMQLEYRFNPYLSSHVGYSYDRMNSDVGDFDRNRVYIGATASY